VRSRSWKSTHAAQWPEEWLLAAGLPGPLAELVVDYAGEPVLAWLTPIQNTPLGAPFQIRVDCAFPWRDGWTSSLTVSYGLRGRQKLEAHFIDHAFIDRDAGAGTGARVGVTTNVRTRGRTCSSLVVSAAMLAEAARVQLRKGRRCPAIELPLGRGFGWAGLSLDHAQGATLLRWREWCYLVLDGVIIGRAHHSATPCSAAARVDSTAADRAAVDSTAAGRAATSPCARSGPTAASDEKNKTAVGRANEPRPSRCDCGSIRLDLGLDGHCLGAGLAIYRGQLFVLALRTDPASRGCWPAKQSARLSLMNFPLDQDGRVTGADRGAYPVPNADPQVDSAIWLVAVSDDLYCRVGPRVYLYEERADELDDPWKLFYHLDDPWKLLSRCLGDLPSPPVFLGCL
jgi:hypothetical protein